MKKIFTAALPYIAGAALIFAVITGVKLFLKSEARSVQIVALSAALDSLQKNTTQLTNENKLLVAQNETLTASSADEITKLSNEVFKLRKGDQKRATEAKAYTRLIQQLKDSNKIARYLPDTPDIIAEKILPEDTGTIKVPKAFVYQDSTMSFNGLVLKNSVKISQINVANTIHLRTIVERKGIFGQNQTTKVQAFNTNPAIQFTGIAQVEVKNRPNWWHRWGKPVLAAAAAGTVTYIIARSGKKTEYIQPTGGTRPPRVYPPN